MAGSGSQKNRITQRVFTTILRYAMGYWSMISDQLLDECIASTPPDEVESVKANSTFNFPIQFKTIARGKHITTSSIFATEERVAMWQRNHSQN